MPSDSINKLKPHKVVTLIREVNQSDFKKGVIHYPELDKMINDGYYVERFQQTLLGEYRYMITFSLKKFGSTTY